MLQKIRFIMLIGVLAAALIVGCKPKDESSGTGNTSGTTGETNDLYGGRPLPTATGNPESGDTIRIGLIASLNGEQQPWGVDSERGVRLAIEQFNEAGGKDGKKIELFVEDTGSKPEGGKSATEKLVGQDRVVAVLGEVASGITLPAAQVCQEAGVPLISIGATRVDVTQTGAAIFRACFTDNFQGAAMAKYAYDDLGLRKVAVLTDRKLPYSTGLSDVFKAAFKSFGGEIVTEEFYEAGQTDFKAQLTNVKAKNPDGLFCSGYFTEVGPIARQRLIVGLDVPMIGGDGWDSIKLLDSGGEGIIGGYFSNHYHNSEQRQEVQDFVAAFQKRWGQPPATAMGALGYDAALVLIEAIKNAKSLDSRGIMESIAQTKDVKGVSGNISMGKDGNAQKPALVLKVERDGFVPVKQVPFFVFEE